MHGGQPDPISEFTAWLEAAENAPEIKYARAMHLATVGADGRPDGRIVLLMEHGGDGFVFFTDERSPTGKALAMKPYAALTFYWGVLDRQVRIRGRVTQLDKEMAQRCFDQRPRGSMVTAWASLQSCELGSIDDLHRRYSRKMTQFGDQEEIPCPPYWKSYSLEAENIEFWEARTHRLHERRLFTRIADNGWSQRLIFP